MTKEGEDAESKQHVLEAVREEKMDYPCFLDPGGSWSRRAGVAHIPAFLVVDRTGRVAFRHVGKLLESSKTFDELANAITQALTEPKPS